jgi:hypothetical protein
MASIIKNKSMDFSHIKCPYQDMTGYDFTIVIKGYCAAGKYCVRKCAYAWLPAEDNAQGRLENA